MASSDLSGFTNLSVKDKKITIVANPDYYDYVHCLNLTPDHVTNESDSIVGTCKFSDGGGQMMNGIWTGTYTLKKNGELTLTWTHRRECNFGNNTSTLLEVPIITTIKLIILKEPTLFFNGYCFEMSRETWRFDRSPCPSFANRKDNLFNQLENDNEGDEVSPLTFYVDIEAVEKEQLTNYTLLARLCSKSVWKLQDSEDFTPVYQDIMSAYDTLHLTEKVSDLQGVVKSYIEKFKEEQPLVDCYDFANDVVDSSKYFKLMQIPYNKMQAYVSEFSQKLMELQRNLKIVKEYNVFIRNL